MSWLHMLTVAQGGQRHEGDGTWFLSIAGMDLPCTKFVVSLSVFHPFRSVFFFLSLLAFHAPSIDPLIDLLVSYAAVTRVGSSSSSL